MPLSEDSIKRANNAGKTKKEPKEKKQNSNLEVPVESNSKFQVPVADINDGIESEKEQAKKSGRTNTIPVGEALPYYLL